MVILGKMNIRRRLLLIAIFAMSTLVLFAQSNDSTRSNSVTFLGKVKFAKILLAGQDRNSVKACNGQECRALGVGASEKQTLIYKKAKIWQIGNAMIEMEIVDDRLRKFEVTTSGKSQTEKIRIAVLNELAVSDFDGKTNTWVTKSPTGETIKSRLTISQDKLNAIFTSWTE